MKLDEPAKLSIFSGACLLFLAFFLKNVLMVSQALLLNEMMLYIIIYTVGFSAMGSSMPKGGKPGGAYYYAAVAIVTIAIIALHII